MNINCPYRGSEMIHLSDCNYDDVYEEGDGVISYLTCSNEICETNIERSKRNKI